MYLHDAIIWLNRVPSLDIDGRSRKGKGTEWAEMVGDHLCRWFLLDKRHKKAMNNLDSCFRVNKSGEVFNNASIAINIREMIAR